ncbi:MAG: PD40 domain-containing protein [Chloroflexi bacterium]|nr:PD40 domain-containing protein [Chloroflexota bacterium]
MHRRSSAAFLAVTALAVLFVVTSCSGKDNGEEPGTSAATVSVADAKSRGFVPRIEYCRNRTLFPDRYRGVAFEDLGGGMCAFYFPPDAETPTATPPPTATVPPTEGASSKSYRNGRIACSERIVGGRQSTIFTYAPDGSDRRALTTSGYNIMPSWSWDGRRILFSSNLGGAAVEIWVMDADGGNKRQLTFDTPGGSFTPVESPDGTRIAYSSMRRSVGHPEVWVMDAGGSNQRRLTTTAVAPGQENVWSLHPSWSPDGKRLAYASTSSGRTQIWVMNADGSGQRQLTHGLGPSYPDANVPTWSIDGSRIAFWSGFERRFGEVWTMDPDGSDPRRVTDTPDPRNSDDPHWSPDGSMIVFGRGQGGDRAMYVAPSGGGEPVLFATGVHWCDWQPVARPSGPYELDT